MYRLTQEPNIVQRLDPEIPGLIDARLVNVICEKGQPGYEDYLTWLSEGNRSLDADPVNLEARFSEIIRARDIIMDRGLLYNGKRYPCTVLDRVNLIGLLVGIQLGFTLPEGFVWRTVDDEGVPFTQADIEGLASAMFGFVVQSFLTTGQERDALKQP